jgi:hypothetical protein
MFSVNWGPPQNACDAKKKKLGRVCWGPPPKKEETIVHFFGSKKFKVSAHALPKYM